MRTNNIIKILFWGLLCLLLSCRGTANKQTADKQIITVSIEPLKFIVETIAGDDFDVEVIVRRAAVRRVIPHSKTDV